MKNLPILLLEFALAGFFVWLGFSGKRIFNLEGARSATILLGVIGMILCTLSVGKFINASPAHFLSILGYLFGTLGFLALLAQIFRWNLPLLGKPEAALLVLAGAMLVKSIIARFGFLLVR